MSVLALNLIDDAGVPQVGLLWMGTSLTAQRQRLKHELEALSTLAGSDEGAPGGWILLAPRQGSAQLLADLEADGWRLAIEAVPVRWIRSADLRDHVTAVETTDLAVEEPHL